MPASRMTVDFSNVVDAQQHSSGVSADGVNKPISSEGKLLTPKQIRARARRKRKKGQHLTEEEMAALWNKPVEEWDLQELAHGRPRNKNGHFSGPTPQWVDREVFEKAMEKYTMAVKTSMKATTVDALDMLNEIIKNSDVDEKGRPLVAYSTKLDAAKFLIEHVVGKPTQRIENDVSVKLQGILGQVMVNPAELATGRYVPAHYPGLTMGIAADDDDLDLDGPGE